MQVDDLFAKTQELPSIPKVVQELIASFEDDDFDVDDVAKKIGMDQVLTAKVMRLANSTRYGGSRTISSVNEAVVRLGFNSLRTLVLASAFTSAFKAPEGFDLKAFWRESFEIAELCRWLARHSPVDPEAAFTCGMLSNIGRLLVHMLIPEKAQEIQRVVEKGGNRHELEKDDLGFTSDEVGAKIASKWHFPTTIIEGVEYQSEPLADPDEGAMPCIVYLANVLYSAHHNGKSDEEIIAEFPNDIARAGQLNLAPVLDSLDSCRELDSGIAELLD